jgi:caffeoyl-CoA O-methyltransferase
MSNTPLEILIDYLQKAEHLAEQECLSKELEECLKQAKRLAIGLHNYPIEYSRKQSKELKAIALSTQNQPWQELYQTKKIKNRLKPEMQSSPFQAQLLKFLVQITKSERVLEIGMFTGYATLAIAEALPNHGSITACDHDHFLIDLANELLCNSKHYSKMKLISGEGKEVLTELINQSAKFDLIFLDANKLAYPAYYELILAGNLLDRAGILCVDNTLFKGEVFNNFSDDSNKTANKIPVAIAEFNRLVANDHRVEQIILGLEDGLSLIKWAALTEA